MVKAFFVDFYGTVVYEDGEIVSKISDLIYKSGHAESAAEVDGFWWKDFQNMFTNSYGACFETQRVLEEKSIVHTIEKYGASVDAKELAQEMFDYWVKPNIFEESKSFFENSPVPVYVVSNIDTDDVMKAIAYHGLKPAGVFTSEDAKSYKPRKEIFELALKETGLNADEVIHIGDSISSDVKGASALGIRTLWLNRFDKVVPDGVEAITNLLEAFDKI